MEKVSLSTSAFEDDDEDDDDYYGDKQDNEDIPISGEMPYN